jgi:hypothetical protein
MQNPSVEQLSDFLRKPESSPFKPYQIMQQLGRMAIEGKDCTAAQAALIPHLEERCERTRATLVKFLYIAKRRNVASAATLRALAQFETVTDNAELVLRFGSGEENPVPVCMD